MFDGIVVCRRAWYHQRAMVSHTRHLIWDWNGTLFDDAWLCIEIINQLLTTRGLPLVDATRYQQAFTFPVETYYRRLGFDFVREPFALLAAEFTTAYDGRRFACGLQRDAHALLHRLEARGYTQSILSAYEQTRLEELVRHTGVHEHFAALAGLSDCYAASKVARGRQAIADLHCPLHEVVLIGDTLHDYEVATALGIDCLLIPSGHYAPERLAHSGAPMLPSLAALEDYLLG